MKYFLFLYLVPVFLLAQSNSAVELRCISDSIWIHTTYKAFGENRIPSNGLIAQTSAGLILIDTPWDDSLTTELIKISKERFKQNIVFAVVTHAHDDRIGGIHALHKAGIKVVGYSLVCQRAKELGYELPEAIFSKDTTFVIGNKKCELFYPGAGHTIDNTVVWFPEEKILFGGCLIKSGSAVDLGSIQDADIGQWPQSIRRIIDRFQTIRTVVPGHGAWCGTELLQHTLNLLSKKREK
jgi:metallo-beta-lactamase class B